MIMVIFKAVDAASILAKFSNSKEICLKVRYLALALNLKEATCQNENLSCLRSHYLSKSDFADKFTGCKFIKRSFVKRSICTLLK